MLAVFEHTFVSRGYIREIIFITESDSNPKKNNLFLLSVFISVSEMCIKLAVAGRMCVSHFFTGKYQESRKHRKLCAKFA